MYIFYVHDWLNFRSGSKPRKYFTPLVCCEIVFWIQQRWEESHTEDWKKWRFVDRDDMKDAYEWKRVNCYKRTWIFTWLCGASTKEFTLINIYNMRFSFYQNMMVSFISRDQSEIFTFRLSTFFHPSFTKHMKCHAIGKNINDCYIIEVRSSCWTCIWYLQ